MLNTEKAVFLIKKESMNLPMKPGLFPDSGIRFPFLMLLRSMFILKLGLVLGDINESA